MGNEYIVVEDGVIKCEHGGKVILKSTVPNHVIGGKKPLYDKDLLNAAISGCPNPSPNGGPCTKVVAISSAVTESNVANQGTNYLLRTDGCKTDKGVAVILSDPGQANTKVPVKSSGSTMDVTVQALKDAKLDTKENLKKERHRIYPLRASANHARALRGARDFKILSNFHSVANGTYKKDKVLTSTDAYLYVTDKKGTKEYKVINRGDIFNPQMYMVQFKDTKTKVLRRYIPFYEESGELEFVYSNVKLKDAERKKFKSTVITIESKKNSCVFHHKEYSKNIKLSEKILKEHIYSAKDIKENSKSRKYLSTIIFLDDPIGEVEDLYEEMHSNFYRAYSHNKTFIDRVKERNTYAYSVANFMDELELSSKEKLEREKTKKKLSEAYDTLVEGMKKEFLPYIIQTCKDRSYTWSVPNSHNTSNRGHTPSVINTKSMLVRLNGFIEYDAAMSYLNDVRLNASFLLKLRYKGGRRGNGNFMHYNAFDGRTTEYLKEKCIVESKSHNYLCLGKNATKYDSKTKILKDLPKQNQYEESMRKNRAEVTALTLFSLYFSGKHDISLQGKYKDAAEDFHYNLKILKAHPEFDEDVQDEINDKLESSVYRTLFQNAKGKRNDTFIDDYADLDTTAKYCAYSWKKKGHISEFKTLVPREETFDFFFADTKKSPEALSKTLSTKLKDSNLKDLLQAYSELKRTDFETVKLFLNIAYSLTASRTMFDAEVTQTSPFNKNSAVIDFLKGLSTTLQSIDATEHEKLYAEGIFTLYHQSLHSIILHSQIEGLYNSDSFSVRKTNANNFLTELAPQTEKEYQLELSNLNDGNISEDLKVKKAHEKLFEQLKALDGITSQVHGAEDKQRAKEESTRGREAKTEKEWTKVVRKSKPYKLSISTMKGLSFFVTLFTTGDALKTYNKNDLKALLEITTGINSITKTVVETGTKVLPRSQKAMVMVDFLLAEHSIPQKIIAKLAIPAVIVGAYYEVEALDNEDYDAMLMISTKAAITVALAFVSGIWIAAAGYIALEILWYLFSSYFIDSRVEVMIEKSLFYQNGRRPYILESLSTTNKQYYIRRGYRDALMSAKDITMIGGAKAVRDFIYKNYEKNKKDLQTAARYEFSEILRALKNISIKVEKIPTHNYYNEYINNYQQTIDLNLNGHIRVNKEYYDEMRGVIYLIEDNNYSDYTFIDATEATDKDKDKLIDIFESFKKDVSSNKLEEASKKDYHILIDSGVNGVTSIKYKLGIEYYYRTEYIGNQFVKKINYYLDELIPTPLSSQDIELLK